MEHAGDGTPDTIAEALGAVHMDFAADALCWSDIRVAIVATKVEITG